MVENPVASSLFPGTITFLFTDIVGSTKLWEANPTGMRLALALHDAILRSAIESNHGQLIKTTGDGVHAGFPNALNAVSAAFSAQCQLQAPLAGVQLSVRMGVHTGEAEMRAGDYYGPALNRAARLMSAAHGGQILVSNATAELVRDQIPQDALLRDLGEHRLKDLARPEHIFQLAHANLPGEFPAIQSIDSFPHNLPVQLTSFVGREKEIAEIRSLLNSARLITLTGSGGTGKTRLALEVGAQELGNYAHGVWLVELAPLADPEQILPALASVFGLQEVPFTPLPRLITDYLHRKNVLLILDNCEHLIEACARLVDDLLRHCAGLKIITSSREALGIGGEVAYRIPSLAESEAIQLFLERARAANTGFIPSASSALAIAQICSRLDGIPLAIELAAARSKLLAPDQISARLNDRFHLLIGGSRTALPRQQTLRAMIDWSYDLLSEEEKRMLLKASVFAGGWMLDALEKVAEVTNTLELLEQLVNKSLVATVELGRQMRYYLLETIRQYAREKLLDAGGDEVRRVRDRHLEFFVTMAEAAAPRLTGPEMVECLDELELEQDNYRAAVEWAIETDPLSALRIARILPDLWGRRLSVREGYAWVKIALARAEERYLLESHESLLYLNARAGALLGEAALAFESGDNRAAQTAINASVVLARQIDAVEILAYALALGATICGFIGDIDTARSWSKESLDLSREHGFAYILATVTGMDLFLAVLMNQPIPPGFGAETIQAARVSGNPWAIGMAYTNVGRGETMAGRFTEAYPLLAEGAALFQKMRDKSMYNAARSEIGHLFRLQGRYAEAAGVYRETIQAYQDLGQRAAIAHELECLAFLAGKQRQHRLAANLFGAAEALRERIQSDMTPIERREYDRNLSDLREEMDAAALAQAWAEGRAMTMEQAIELASKG